MSTLGTTSLFACRRNNKLEKRKRNKIYARKFAATKLKSDSKSQSPQRKFGSSQGGPSRRKVVIEEKRAVVAASEERFVAGLFKFTTDEDMPSYTAFDFSK